MTGGGITMLSIQPYALNNNINKTTFTGHRSLDPEIIVATSGKDTIASILEQTENIRQENFADDGNLGSLLRQVLKDLGLLKNKKITKRDIDDINNDAKEIRENLDNLTNNNPKRTGIFLDIAA